MFDQIQNILKQNNILFHSNEGITIATVDSLHDGFALSQEILYKLIDPRTVLYLSGGRTPKVLYERFAASNAADSPEEMFTPGAVAMVEERFGPKFHALSNEKMLQETGLLRYLQMRNIPFYPILSTRHREPEGRGDLHENEIASSSTTPRNDELRKQTAESYDEQLRTLNATYQKSIAILGIGVDGHIAGIPAQSLDTKYDLFAEYHDTSGRYGERMTMTFVALEMMDVLFVLVFGDEKKKTLEQLFSDGHETEIPARFFKRPDIAKKTLLITDQRI